METGRPRLNTILKKQSQFAGALIDVSSFSVTYYGDSAASGLPKKKARQSQFRKSPADVVWRVGSSQ
jgi:hypothetical protein